MAEESPFDSNGGSADLKRARRRKPDDLQTDRLPPHAEDMERGVLGCCLLSPNECLDQCIEIIGERPEPFYDLRHQTIYTALVEMYDAREVIDLLTLHQRLKDRQLLDQIGGIPYLNQLQDSVTSSANVTYYAQVVSEKWFLRRMIHGCTSIVERTYEHQGEVGVLKDEVERDMLAMIGAHTTNGFQPIRSFVTRSISEIEAYHENQGAIMGLTTGFPDLDRMTGGFNGGEMIVIAARPSMGKTSLAMNIAEHVAVVNRLPVGVFSMEMTSQALTTRLIASNARVNLRNIRDGFMSEVDFPRLTAAAGRVNAAPLFIDDTPGLSVMQLRSKARKLMRTENIRLFVIDYLQLAKSLTKRGQENRQQEVSEISSGIKALAKELNVPIIVLSQLNRELEKDKKRKPRLSDIRESGCLSVASTKLFTTDGVLCNTDSRMNTYSLNTQGKLSVRSSKNIPKPAKAMVRVVLRSGRYLDCTPDHPVLTDVGFVPAKKITPAHGIAAVRTLPEPARAIEIPEARWIGWMLGNGSMIGYSSPSFICSDETIAEDFKATTKRLFDLTPKVHAHSCAAVFQYDITAGPVRTADGNPCKDWLKNHQLWGRRSFEKRIPDWFMSSADNESIAELVAGLVETDGSITGRSVKYSTTSNEMAWQFVWCLARLGIFSYIDAGYFSSKSKHSCYTVRIADGRDVERFRNRVAIHGRKGGRLAGLVLSKAGSNHGDRLGLWVNREIIKAANAGNFSWKQLNYRVQGKRISQQDFGVLITKLPALKKFQHLVTDAIYWDRLESISQIDNGEVFDREVIGGPHNFVANGIIVHNSIEQDADLVGFLYKPNRGDDEDDALPEEADGLPVNLLIAKQRNGPTGDVNLVFIKSLTRFENAARVSDEDCPRD